MKKLKKYLNLSRRFILAVSTLLVFGLSGCGRMNANISDKASNEFIETTKETSVEEVKISGDEETKEPGDTNKHKTEAFEKTDTAMIPDIYQDILRNYYTAILEKRDTGWYIENDMNYLLSEDFSGGIMDNVGYAIIDLDNDGNDELIIGLNDNVTDEFYQKMILIIYSGEQEVFSSMERDRIYYAGENKFASLGSSGAAYSFETTLKYENGEMIDMTYITDVSAYEQMTLIPFSSIE